MSENTDQLSMVECDELFDILQEILSGYDQHQATLTATGILSIVEAFASKENRNIITRRLALAIISESVQQTFALTRELQSRTTCR